jgi:hypothetical protein
MVSGGFCRLAGMIDARGSNPVQRTATVVTAEDAMAMPEPGDILIDCMDLYRARNATSRQWRTAGPGDHPFASSPVFLLGDSAICSPYFQSISLGFEWRRSWRDSSRSVTCHPETCSIAMSCKSTSSGFACTCKVKLIKHNSRCCAGRRGLQPPTGAMGAAPHRLLGGIWHHHAAGSERSEGGGAMSVSDKLMSASDRLAELAGRAKQAEDRAAAARGQAKGELERSADKARAEAQAHAEKLRASANATEGNVSESWNDMQETLNAHIAKARKSIGEKKDEIDVKRAEKSADNAEDDALFAIDYAYVTIEEAESAVLDAIVARSDANELATR